VRPRRLEATERQAFTLPITLIKQLKDEGKKLKKHAATIVEIRLYHSYEISPQLPTGPRAA
jgi:hypothetical protein